MILRFTWLDKHNLEIDFRTRSVKMTRCLPRCCVGCQADRKAEQNARREDTKRINTCRTGPFPAFVEDADEEDETEPTPEQFPNPEADFLDEPLEEGNRIWATGLFPPGGTHSCNRYGLSTARGRLPTEFPTLRAHPAASP